MTDTNNPVPQIAGCYKTESMAFQDKSHNGKIIIKQNNTEISVEYLSKDCSDSNNKKNIIFSKGFLYQDKEGFWNASVECQFKIDWNPPQHLSYDIFDAHIRMGNISNRQIKFLLFYRYSNKRQIQIAVKEFIDV